MGFSDVIINLWHLNASKKSTHGSLQGIALVGPDIHWKQGQSTGAKGLISKWVASISVAPHTEEVAGIVVDTLLQIAANSHLRPFIPPNAWLWLNDRPPLRPAHQGLLWGCNRDIVRTVRALGDIGILTSYLIVIWPRWRFIGYDGLAEMQISVCEDFKGIGMGYHRAKLIQRLDSVFVNQRPQRPYFPALHELFASTHRLAREKPNLRSQRRELRSRRRELESQRQEFESQCRELESQRRELESQPQELESKRREFESQYREFERILQEMDQEATEILDRIPSSLIFLSMLTPMDLHRSLLHLHVCPASPVSVTPRLG